MCCGELDEATAEEEGVDAGAHGGFDAAEAHRRRGVIEGDERAAATLTERFAPA